MSDQQDHLEEIGRLVGLLLEGGLDSEDRRRMEQLLATDDAALACYEDYIELHSLLHWHLGITAEDESCIQQSCRPVPLECAVSQPISVPVPVASFPFYGSRGSLAASWPVAYSIATVIFAIAAVVGAFTYVSKPGQLADQGSTFNSQSPISISRSVVGQVTGLVDCQWAGTDRIAREVSLGSRYELNSGLAEITYNTGARVILQGPVVYEVNSDNGGYLSAGRLTARVEKKAEGGGRKAEEVTSGQWPVAGESQISNLRSDVPDSPPSPVRLPPSQSTNHRPLFTIETPTAIVTDLGTEFGVEVDKQGVTTSHVFRGSVKVQQVGEGEKAEGEGQVLRENETVRVERRGNQSELVTLHTFTPLHFVRGLPEPAGKKEIKSFDLVDVVAGGDGFSQHRNLGIDVNTGRPVSELILRTQDNPNTILNGDGLYHRTEDLRFVDGVFVPDGSNGPQQTDSAGHRFAGFPSTTKTTSNHIWVGGDVPPGVNDGASRTGLELGGIDFSSPEHGFLLLHANKGITFDLEAIRNANPDCRLLRFRAVAGNVEWIYRNDVMLYADFWVLVDGRLRYQRQKINGWRGAFWVDVPLRSEDHFLTLAATDAGDGIGWDWIVFGDPQLEMAVVVPEKKPLSASP